MQRGVTAAELTGQQADHQQDRLVQKMPATIAADVAKSTDQMKQRKVLRTYGQKKAKADSAAESASPNLPADFLALVGGKK